MSKENFVLGVDIGNTKTFYALCRLDGTVVRAEKGAGANYQEIGQEEMVSRLTGSITGILRAEGISPNQLRFIYYGAAGADTPQDFEILQGAFARVVPGIPFDFENDGWIALHSGTRGGPGMVVTFGTGNTNFAVNSRGEKKRIGGLDEHLGDMLGAYSLARRTVYAARRSEDGRDEPTILTSMVRDYFKLNSTAELINYELDDKMVKNLIQLFFKAAQKGDGLALSICWELAAEVIRIVKEFYNALFQQEEKFTLVLEGTVFKQKYQPLHNMLELALHERYNLDIVTPDYDPVLGAVFLAFKGAEIALPKETTDRIITSFKEKVQ